MHPWLVYVELPGAPAGLDLIRVPTYFACLMLGFALASVVLRREALRDGLPPRAILDLAALAVPAVLVGARIAHLVLVASPAERMQPLAWTSGGFVFYGGLAAGALLVVWWGRRTGLDAWRIGDVFAPAVAFGLMFGRLGCLGAGCCHGRPADWPLGVVVPWAVRYWHRGHVPDELLAVPLHPTPLYEAVLAWLLFVGLGLWRARQRVAGEVALGFVGAYGLGRSLIEVFRGDVARGVYLDGWLSTSQILGVSSAAIAFSVLFRRRRAATDPVVVR